MCEFFRCSIPRACRILPVAANNKKKKTKLYREKPRNSYKINNIFILRKGGGLWEGWEKVQVNLKMYYRQTEAEKIGKKLWRRI